MPKPGVMRDCISHKKGYFLLEVVLAIAIAALLMRGVFALANGSLALSNTMSEEGARAISNEAFFTFLGRNLSELPGNAELRLTREDGGSHYTSDLTFQNVPTSFSWAGQAISAEAIQLSAVLRRDGDLDIVLRYYEDAILDDSDSTANVNAEPVAEIVLLRDVWRFEWWALDGRTMEWTEEWDVRGRQPLQLELNVIFDRNGEEIIHYFWIPPKVNPETVMRSQLRAGPAARGEGTQPGDQPTEGAGPNPSIRPGNDRGGGTRPDTRPGAGNPTTPRPPPSAPPLPPFPGR